MLIHRGRSSVGEHAAEDRGVLGSNPSGPTQPFLERKAGERRKARKRKAECLNVDAQDLVLRSNDEALRC